MKNIYEIPELNIICFAPLEAVADEFIDTYFYGSHGGQGDGQSAVEVPVPSPTEERDPFA